MKAEVSNSNGDDFIKGIVTVTVTADDGRSASKRLFQETLHDYPQVADVVRHLAEEVSTGTFVPRLA